AVPVGDDVPGDGKVVEDGGVPASGERRGAPESERDARGAALWRTQVLHGRALDVAAGKEERIGGGPHVRDGHGHREAVEPGDELLETEGGADIEVVAREERGGLAELSEV